MIKFTAEAPEGGTLYGFGLSKANLNRLEFNNEPIFFDFGYAGLPDLFGLMAFMGKFATPEDLAANIEDALNFTGHFMNKGRGVTPETLHFFPIVRSVMQEFRSTPYWGYQTNVEITSPKDIQLIFSGITEADMERYFVKAGLISRKTKRTYKGFERR